MIILTEKIVMYVGVSYWLIKIMKPILMCFQHMVLNAIKNNLCSKVD